MNQVSTIITILAAISIGIYINDLHQRIRTMENMLHCARRLTAKISEHDAQATKIMKRKFNTAHDAFFGVRHPTRQIKARATAMYDA